MDTYDMVHQGEIWIMRNGEEIRIEDMGRFHAANCVRLLERRANFMILGAYAGAMKFMPSEYMGDMAAMTIEILIEEEFGFDKTPLEWLRSTELHKALSSRAKVVPEAALDIHNRAWRVFHPSST